MAAPSSPRGVEHPEAFVCPVSLELMSDPVLDPEGVTYDKASILAWLKRSPTSPVSQSPLAPHQLYPNRALKVSGRAGGEAEGGLGTVMQRADAHRPVCTWAVPARLAGALHHVRACVSFSMAVGPPAACRELPVPRCGVWPFPSTVFDTVPSSSFPPALHIIVHTVDMPFWRLPLLAAPWLTLLRLMFECF